MSCPAKKRDVAIQHVAMPQNTPAQGSNSAELEEEQLLKSAFSTPKKASHQKIKFLPGKSSTLEPSGSKERCRNKCEVCEVKYKSRVDLRLDKEFKRENIWLGCERGCDYWGHARCFGIVVGKSVIDDIPFTCPNHSK